MEESQKPNVFYFHVDNLGYRDLGCYGGAALRGARKEFQDSVKHEPLIPAGAPLDYAPGKAKAAKR
jgi:arylsulfatase A-like enzyme